MKEGWMKNDEWRMMKDEWEVMKDEWWRMKDDDFKLWGVLQTNGRTDKRTDEQTFVIVESLSRLKSIDDASPLMTKVDLWLKSIDD